MPAGCMIDLRQNLIMDLLRVKNAYQQETMLNFAQIMINKILIKKMKWKMQFASQHFESYLQYLKGSLF